MIDDIVGYNKNSAQLLQSATLIEGTQKGYEIDDTFRAGKNTFEGVHTVSEVVKLLETDPKIEFEGIFLGADDDGELGVVKMNREKFLESWKRNSRKGKSFKKMYEAFNGGSDYTGGNILGGSDYTPLLGGPFHKQLYLHDMLRMFALAFFASNHDPMAKALLNITVDFTLGRGFRVDSKDKGALALWRSFEKVNKLPELMRHMAYGIARDGEVMINWLPGNQPFEEWQLSAAQTPPKVLIPRIKLMDPSTCWEVITYPEDIDRVVAYQFVYPTQYNLYSAQDQGETVRSMKFIFQQVPAAQIDHVRVNRSPNEKRGRSDLYAAFGFLKRLRDTVEYSVVAMAKASAWAIDTTVEGSPADIQNYLRDQLSKKSIAPAGSEFIHSPKIKREYLSNKAAGESGGSVSAFEWCLNMVCAAVQIPVSYLGTHLSGGQTKASAMVGTEPVTKKFEARQQVYEQAVKAMWDRLMKMYGLTATCEITFPELISQDRSAKIKDLITAQEVGAIDHEYMSTTIAQELGNSSYDYQATQKKIAQEKAQDLSARADNILISPLTALPTAPPSAGSGAPSASAGAASATAPPAPKVSKVTKDQRVNQRRSDTN